MADTTITTVAGLRAALAAGRPLTVHTFTRGRKVTVTFKAR